MTPVVNTRRLKYHHLERGVWAVVGLFFGIEEHYDTAPHAAAMCIASLFHSLEGYRKLPDYFLFSWVRGNYFSACD